LWVGPDRFRKLGIVAWTIPSATTADETTRPTRLRRLRKLRTFAWAASPAKRLSS
jgi:hypothetical protein